MKFLKLFKRPVWKEVSREYLRREYDFDGYFLDIFDVYAVTYKDLNSDKTKTEEKLTLV